MKFKPAPVRVKQPELSDREKAALRAVANGAVVEPLLCQRLNRRQFLERPPLRRGGRRWRASSRHSAASLAAPERTTGF